MGVDYPVFTMLGVYFEAEKLYNFFQDKFPDVPQIDDDKYYQFDNYLRKLFEVKDQNKPLFHYFDFYDNQFFILGYRLKYLNLSSTWMIECDTIPNLIYMTKEIEEMMDELCLVGKVKLSMIGYVSN